MAGNARTAIVGVAFAVLAIAAYQYIYKVGIWTPNISTKAAIDNALARADRVTAAQAKADLDALLLRAEKGERLDRAELERLIKLAATDAGSLDALYKEAEIKSRGVIVAPPPTAPQIQSGPPAAPVPSGQAPATSPSSRPRPPQQIAAPPERSSAQEAKVTFFESRLEIPSCPEIDKPSWSKVTLPPGVDSVEVVVTGEITLHSPLADGRTLARAIGISLRSVPNWKGEADYMEQGLVVPELPYLAAISRICDLDSCSTPKPFTGNPWKFSVPAGKWLEFHVNRVFSGDYRGWNPSGQYLLRFQPCTGACGK